HATVTADYAFDGPSATSIGLTVRNPFTSPITVTEWNLKVSVKGQSVALPAAPPPLTVGPCRRDGVRVRAPIARSTVLAELDQYRQVPVRVELNANIDGPKGPQPLAVRDERLDLSPLAPDVGIHAIGMQGDRVVLRLTLWNRGDTPIEVTQVLGTVLIAKQELGATVPLPSAVRLGFQQSREAALFIDTRLAPPSLVDRVRLQSEVLVDFDGFVTAEELTFPVKATGIVIARTER